MLQAMVERTAKALDDLGVPEDQRLQVLTEASIVQAEGRTPDDMAKIARVLDNRLAIGMPLQLDTTVNYANGKSGVTTTPAGPGQPLAVQHLRAHGPAAGPDQQPGRGRDARRPGPGAGLWLYFVVVDPDTGETRFADHGAGGAGQHGAVPAVAAGAPRPVEGGGLGRPVAHSLSPLLHRAAYAVLGLDDWTVRRARPGRRRPAGAAGRARRGVARLLGDHAVQAGGGGRRRRGGAAAAAAARGEHAGAHRGGLAGGEHRRRRDRHGAAVAGVDDAPAAAVVGAGGTAAAAAVALASLGARHVEVVVREPARAGDLVRVLDVLDVAGTVHRFADAVLAAPSWSAPCRSTPSPPCSACPGAPGTTVLDVLYAPWPTPLAQRLADVGGHGGRAASRCCSGRPPSRWS